MSEAGPPQVVVFLPGLELRDYVTFFYTVATDAPVDDFLYPEWGNVRFALSGDWHVGLEGYSPDAQGNVVFGHTDRCARVTATFGRCIGFGLTPIGWQQFIGGSAAAMANRCRPLGSELGLPAQQIHDALMSKATDQERVAYLDQLLSDLLRERPPEPPSVIELDRILKERPTHVEDFAKALRVSPRTLQRLCLAVYGFAPKRLIRRQRFMDTLGRFRAAVGMPLDQALDPEYFDQPQFYRDFKDFMGMSLREYFSAPRPLMEQAARAQAEAGVTLSFKLPPTSARQLSLAAPPAEHART